MDLKIGGLLSNMSTYCTLEAHGFWLLQLVMVIYDGKLLLQIAEDGHTRKPLSRNKERRYSAPSAVRNQDFGAKVSLTEQAKIIA